MACVCVCVTDCYPLPLPSFPSILQVRAPAAVDDGQAVGLAGRLVGERGRELSVGDTNAFCGLN